MSGAEDAKQVEGDVPMEADSSSCSAQQEEEVLKRSMVESYLRKHHLFLRITSVLTLILLIGLWESKVRRSLKGHWRHLGLNLSQHNNQHNTENLLMLHQMEKMEVPQKIHLQKNKKVMLVSFCPQGVPNVIQMVMKLLIA